MIKLGIPQSKDQVKVDSLVSTINSTKLELEEILAKKNLTQKELNDTLIRLDFAVEECESQVKVDEFNLTNTNLKLKQLNDEVAKLELIKAELLDKVIEASNELESSKESIKSDILEFTASESTVLHKLQEDIKVLNAKKLNLEQYIEVLSLDSSDNEIALNDIKAEVSKLEVELVIKRNEELELSRLFSEVSDTHKLLSDEVVSLHVDITNMNDIINSLSAEITNIKLIKDKLQSEVDTLTFSKEEFNREKLAFQANKELILLREQFIIEKYNLAGVPYN
jgi:chromosome segregation ATPase